jgi:hypothetical protein
LLKRERLELTLRKLFKQHNSIGRKEMTEFEQASFYRNTVRFIEDHEELYKLSLRFLRILELKSVKLVYFSKQETLITIFRKIGGGVVNKDYLLVCPDSEKITRFPTVSDFAYMLATSTEQEVIGFIQSMFLSKGTYRDACKLWFEERQDEDNLLFGMRVTSAKTYYQHFIETGKKK